MKRPLPMKERYTPNQLKHIQNKHRERAIYTASLKLRRPPMFTYNDLQEMQPGLRKLGDY